MFSRRTHLYIYFNNIYIYIRYRNKTVLNVYLMKYHVIPGLENNWLNIDTG